MRWTESSNENSSRCSFCGTSQKDAGKLISSPSGTPRVYICDECVATCAAVIQDDKIDSEVPQVENLREGKPSHPLLGHPLASDLMQAVERWIREQSLGNDALVAMAEVRRIAAEMLSESQGGIYATEPRL
jgi:ATP-dependent protease Clp ATPase subunit